MLYYFSFKEGSKILYCFEKISEQSGVHKASFCLNLEAYKKRRELRKSLWVDRPQINSVSLEEVK